MKTKTTKTALPDSLIFTILITPVRCSHKALHAQMRCIFTILQNILIEELRAIAKNL